MIGENRCHTQVANYFDHVHIRAFVRRRVTGWWEIWLRLAERETLMNRVESFFLDWNRDFAARSQYLAKKEQVRQQSAKMA